MSRVFVKTWALSLLASALLFASCGATRGYAGPERPSSETAVLIGMQPWSLLNPGVTTKVTKVDGVPVEDGTKIELLPGRRTLEVYANHSFGKGSRVITVELEAGVEYLLAMSTDPQALVAVIPNGKR
jgi:hypothetical protein